MEQPHILIEISSLARHGIRSDSFSSSLPPHLQIVFIKISFLKKKKKTTPFEPISIFSAPLDLYKIRSKKRWKLRCWKSNPGTGSRRIEHTRARENYYHEGMIERERERGGRESIIFELQTCYTWGGRGNIVRIEGARGEAGRRPSLMPRTNRSRRIGRLYLK